MCTTIKKEKSNASLCIKCGKCEKHCPQDIPIREKLEQVVKTYETPLYHLAAWVLKRFGGF